MEEEVLELLVRWVGEMAIKVDVDTRKALFKVPTCEVIGLSFPGVRIADYSAAMPDILYHGYGPGNQPAGFGTERGGISVPD